MGTTAFGNTARALGLRAILAGLTCLFAVAASAATEYSKAPDSDVWQYLSQNPEHTLVAGAFERLDIGAILRDHITGAVIVAPTDAAIGAVDPTLAQRVRSDAVLGTLVAAHHIPRLRVKPDDMTGPGGRMVVTSYSDDDLVFARDGEDITVNGVPVLEAVEVSNGWIYRIDAVLMPEHLIAEDAPQPRTIMETACDDPELTRFCERMKLAGMDGPLADSTQSLTIFIPTDAALAKVPEEMRTAILENPEYFRRLVLNHILSTPQKTGTLRGQASVTSLSFDTVPIRGHQYKALQVGLATITEGNIAATNGIIHKIDGVLIPPAVVNAIARDRAAAASAPQE